MTASLAPAAPALPASAAEVLTSHQWVLDLVFKDQPAFPLPADPHQALHDVIVRIGDDLGFPIEPAETLAQAKFSDLEAGRLANILVVLHSCMMTTQAAIASIGLDELVAKARADPSSIDLAAFAGVRDCAEAAMRAGADLERDLRALHPDVATPSLTSPTSAAPATTSAEVLIWPVLAFDRTGDDTYAHDVMLSVDLAGDDVYNNNQGSNMIDLRFAPAQSRFPGVDPNPASGGDRAGFGPSEGCAVALGSLIDGNCTPLAAFQLDLGGNDVYGVLETPVPGLDARCTADLVIRRMVTQGLGFAGFGAQVDTSGNDVYTGKTVVQGSGHIGGVGVLLDRSGNDKYFAVRNSQGFQLVALAGLLADTGGNDRYEFYMPAPLDPTAGREEEGTGGVIDDTNLCDDLSRFMQGASNVAGVAILVDTAGNDKYVAGDPADDFCAPAGQGQSGNQGFGNNGALGVLIDTTGNDRYDGGMAGRQDHNTVVTTPPDVPHLEPDPCVPGNQQLSSTALGLFVDV